MRARAAKRRRIVAQGEAKPWVKTPQRESPDGARRQTGPFVAEEGDVRRVFTGTRNKTARQATTSIRGTVKIFSRPDPYFPLGSLN